MGVFVKLLDLLLFVYFFFIAIVAPLFDGQTALPKHMFPPVLVDLKNWYTQEYGDYLVSEKPHFFVGLIWLELLFAWPLCLLSLYAIAAGKSWLNTICLLYGVSTLTAMSWYTQEYGDYLVSEKPHFFVGLIWLELLFAWPLCVISLYAIAAGKSWLNTTCLLYGVSTLTAMVAILSEMKASERASDKLLMVYYPFLGFAVLAILRGLLPHSGKSVSIGKRSAVSRKKRA